MNICIIGNCQAGSIKASAEYLFSGVTATVLHVSHDNILSDGHAPDAVLAGSDLVITQEAALPFTRDGRQLALRGGQQQLIIPSVVFQGFQPDMFYLPGPPGQGFVGPGSDYSSKLTLAGFFLGLSPEQTLKLYTGDVYRRLGWHFIDHVNAFIATWKNHGINIRETMDAWIAGGRFMHTLNHPQLRVVSDIVKLSLEAHGLQCRAGNAADYMNDPIMPTIWPSPPGLALPGSCRGDGSHFKLPVPGSQPQQFQIFSLPDYIADAHARLAGLTLESLEKTFFLKQFETVLRKVKPYAEAIQAGTRLRVPNGGGNPYRDLPDFHIWRKAVAEVPSAAINPLPSAGFAISRSERVATAGSCFAQHIARRLAAAGYTYHVTEAAPAGFTAEQAAARSYGLFSARYGNIYTVKQLRQLCERAFGLFTPEDSAWPGRKGGFIDPFRPDIEPEPFQTEADVSASRAQHLDAVRRLFISTDTFIFTLGLTEAWRAKSDGAVFPLPPGAVSSMDDTSDYEFVNFEHDEIRDDLAWVMAFWQQKNPSIRFVLTVSPVPLIATYEQRHVLVSTMASKSILRAVADEIVRRRRDVLYFPSYEIIAAPSMRGAYFAADLRSVTEAGVDHVMRVFFEACTDEDEGDLAGEQPAPAALMSEIAAVSKVVCDEELLLEE